MVQILREDPVGLLLGGVFVAVVLWAAAAALSLL